MRNLLILAVIAPALAGCASLESGITSLSNTIEQPNVQAALATVKTVGTALVCDVAAGSTLAKSIETAAGAHTGPASQIAVASTTVCAALQGAIVSGVTVTNVPAVTAVQ